MKVLFFMLFDFVKFGIDADALFYVNMMLYRCFQLFMIWLLAEHV